ncbi:hypothetical protein CkaCkLH20_00543 [Colletotrichum karsti]|uniref:Aminotransferase class V domain-containing protein n=1 Tax=Colletotrichum karsti TaxID=1095194 RepID=A0A9P6IFM7_9PEZI|nr:uncharacterized protein CkaCkLH20_00543 [Colletotrichum karsti]KAF9882507.1 hypothetical protein CkaCkLH20_00543 [Colletotrichum karsti]
MTASESAPHPVRTPFGKPMREKYFLFAQGHVNLNHGSFGGYPNTVRAALRRYQDAAEAEPDRFIRYVFPDLLRRSRSLLASHLNCPVDELVLCPNVTTATNTVLRNLQWGDGDRVIYTSGVYGALEKTIESVLEDTNSIGVKIDLDLPSKPDEIVSKFRSALQREKQACKQTGEGTLKLAIFDTIVSMPGLLMPFEEMTKVCREEGVLSMIDGAHGLGHIPIDLEKLNPDFFTSNCHKWLFVPRAVAAFFVPKRNQHLIRTTFPTSHGFVPRSLGKGMVHDPMPSSAEPNQMIRQFEYFGTMDGAPYCCIEEALRFFDVVCGGHEAVRLYCTDLARRAEELFVETLGTESFGITEAERVFFAQVRMPIQVGDDRGKGQVPLEDVGLVTDWMHKAFADQFRTYMYLLFYRGAWWARLSAAVYVDFEDCQYAAKVLKDVSEQVRSGGYK